MEPWISAVSAIVGVVATICQGIMYFRKKAEDGQREWVDRFLRSKDSVDELLRKEELIRRCFSEYGRKSKVREIFESACDRQNYSADQARAHFDSMWDRAMAKALTHPKANASTLTWLKANRILMALIVWTTLHSGIWIFAVGRTERDTTQVYLKAYGFWPLTMLTMPLETIWLYDATEFFVYVIVPWVVFTLWFFFWRRNANE